MPDGFREIASFDTPGNFLFDDDKIEVAPISDPTVARLKPNASLTFAATYAETADPNNIDAAFSRDGGSLVGTPTGGAVVDLQGSLDLRGGTLKLVNYDPVNNIDQTVANAGAIRLGVRFNFTGNPANVQRIFIIGKLANNANLISIVLLTSGVVQVTMNANNGSSIVSLITGGIFPVKDELIEIEWNWNFSSGVSQLFVRGIQRGPTDTNTSVRQASVDTFNTGAQITGLGSLPDFRMSEVAVFDAPQHTSAYTPGLDGLIVSKADPTIKPQTTFIANALLSYSDITTIQQLTLDAIGRFIEVNGIPMWFNISLSTPAWVTSNLSLAESNTEAEMNDNFPALMLAVAGANCRGIWLLHSEDGLTTPTITSATIGRNFPEFSIERPAECILQGQVLVNGEPEPGAVVFLDHAGFRHGESFLNGRRVEDVANAEGEFELQVPETETIGIAPYTLRLGSRRFTNVSIPNQATCTLEDLGIGAQP